MTNVRGPCRALVAAMQVPMTARITFVMSPIHAGCHPESTGNAMTMYDNMLQMLVNSPMNSEKRSLKGRK